MRMCARLLATRLVFTEAAGAAVKVLDLGFRV